MTKRMSPPGGSGEVLVTVSNVGGRDVGMLVVIVGLPGGLQPRVDKLRELSQVGWSYPSCLSLKHPAQSFSITSSAAQ